MPLLLPLATSCLSKREQSKGTGMSNSIVKSTATSTIQTLQSLIKQKMKEKGLPRPQLALVLGYSNINKGTRRLDTFLRTLDAPSEQFIINLLTVLEIDALSFNKSINTSLREFSANAKKNFKPYIEILLGIQVRPSFAYHMIENPCFMYIPSKLQNQPLREEILAINDIYKEHIANTLSEDISKHIIGLNYHRDHNYYLKFNSDFTLEETVFIQALPSRKVPLGNRVVDTRQHI